MVKNFVAILVITLSFPVQVLSESEYKKGLIDTQKVIFKVPPNSKAFTNKDYKRITVYPFMKRWLGKENKYQKHPLFEALCKKKAAILDQAKEALALSKAKKILKGDPYDTIALIFMHCCDYKYYSPAEWRRKSRTCKKKVSDDLYRYFLTLIENNGSKKISSVKQQLNLLFDFAKKNKLNKRDSQFIFRQIDLLYLKKTAEWYNKILDIHEDNIWLREVLLGKAHIKLAWKARGSGWASTVSKEGWKGFAKNLEAAGNHLEKAWSLHNDLPEPASYMITVLKGKSANHHETADWFNRGVTAQADYKRLYWAVMKAIRPRWGGSAELLMTLGDECIKSQLYETIIPEYSLWFFRMAAADTKDYRWMNLYRRKKVIEKIEKQLKHFWKQQNNIKDDKQYYYLTSLGMCCFYAGKYDRTQEIIDDIGPGRFKSYERKIHKMKSYLFPTWMRVSEHMNYFNHEFGSELKNIEDDFHKGNTSSAIDKLKKLINNDKLSEKEHKFILELWGRYSLAVYPYLFSSGNNSLFVAPLQDRYDIADELLSMGYNIESKNKWGKTPLYFVAVNYNYLKAVKFLVEEGGANVNTKDKYGKTMLYRLASIHNTSEVIKYLIKSGAKVDEANNYGTTPLMRAIYKKDMCNIKLLVEAGADVNAMGRKIGVKDFVEKANDPEITRYMKEHGCKLD